MTNFYTFLASPLLEEADLSLALVPGLGVFLPSRLPAVYIAFVDSRFGLGFRVSAAALAGVAYVASSLRSRFSVSFSVGKAGEKVAATRPDRYASLEKTSF